MTAKIERFLREQLPATPCLVLDLDRVEANYRSATAGFPHARVFYALKANPGMPILRRLAALGSHFDAASWEEIEFCLAAGAPPERISFGNTIKKAASIRRARQAGIDLFVFDCEAELEKLAEHAPGARVFCRLMVATEGAAFPLARKFGTSAEAATELLLRAQALGLDPYGVSFHVGSQQTRTEAHESAIGQAAMVFDDLRAAGIRLRMINIGGGFPTRYQEDIPSMADFSARIHHAMQFHFKNEQPELFVEPGRFMVGDAATLESEVVLVSRRQKTDALRWVYLDIGRYGGLSETEGELTKYRITTAHDGGEDGPVILAGPTCDSADTLYEKAIYSLPMALKAGDRVQIHHAGAYVTTYATTGFNGFKPLDEHYV